MKRILLAFVAATALATPAFATKIGVSMDKFDDNFLTVLRNGIADYAKTQPGVSVQIEDAKDDVSKQLSQVQNFIANGVDAIIVNPVDTSATAAITRAAADAGVPLVYVNRQPADLEKLGPKAAFVGSNEAESGTFETKEICKILGGKGDILVIEGQLSNQAAVQRTKDIHDVLAIAGLQRHQDHRRADRELGPHQGPEPDDQLAVEGHEVRRRRLQQRRDGDRRPSGDEVGRRRHQEVGRRRRRRDAGRARIDEGGRPQGRLCSRTRPGRARARSTRRWRSPPARRSTRRSTFPSSS